MSNELKQLLESVLHNSLKPIHSELQTLNHHVGNLETRFGELESVLNLISSRNKD